MKKYLMIGFAAIAFASCSNHDIETMSQEQIIKAQYEANFVAQFGQPASNQDWGFGATTRAAAPIAFTRSVPGITFPTFSDGDCPSMPTIYSNTVPGGAIYAKTYAEEHPHDKFPEGATIYINEAYPQFYGENQVGNVQNLTIYIDGNITLDGGFNQNGNGTTLCVTENSTLKLKSVVENLTIYLAPKAQLDLSESEVYVWNSETNTGGTVNGAVFTKSTAALYMNSGSTVSGGALFFKDGYTVLNEAGTINVGELHVENGAVLYNKNEITATGVIALRNTNGEIDNFGVMSGNALTMDANAKFYNVAGGEVTIEGSTKINNDSGTNFWQNSGQYQTGSFEITGGCQDPAAFNNCHMIVDGEFFMNHGNFVLDGGAAVEAASFKWESDNYFHMGSKALLKVTGQMLMHNINSSPKYGFWGDGSEYAVIQAGSIQKKDAGKYRAAYYGNLFIDTNNHFTQGETSADGTFYYFDETVKFSFTDNTDISGLTSSPARTAQKATDFSIVIEKDNEEGCTPGYSYVPSNPVVYTGRIMAEDLSAQYDPTGKTSDWDFNDVVFDWAIKDGKAYIKLLAAGGTLPIRIGGTRNDNSSEPAGSVEIHNNVNGLGGYMKNCGVGNEVPAAELVLDDHEYTDAKNILITVYKGGSWVEIEAEQGQPAAKFNCKVGTKWCDEYVNISRVYPNFTTWVANPSVDWTQGDGSTSVLTDKDLTNNE